MYPLMQLRKVCRNYGNYYRQNQSFTGVRVTALKCFATFTRKHQRWSKFNNQVVGQHLRFCLEKDCITGATVKILRNFAKKQLNMKLPGERLTLKLEPEAAVCRCSSKQMFLKISQYSQESTRVGISFSQIFRPEVRNFIKKSLQHRCFPVNIAKCFTAAFFIELLWWLLLQY